jgi:hypothetical protein
MAVSCSLERLLRIRKLDEQQRRMLLESAVGELHLLEQALEAAARRDRQGRRLVFLSARTGEASDRLSGLEESSSAGGHASFLAPRIARSKEGIVLLREQFLASRVECRQAETLIEEAEARDAIEAARRGQQAVDDWFGLRRYRREGIRPSESSHPADPDAPPAGPEEA